MISNSTEISSNDFSLNNIMKNCNIQKIESVNFKELISEKLKNTINSLENRIYLALSFFFLFLQYKSGYEILNLPFLKFNLDIMASSIFTINLNADKEIL